MAGVVPKLAVLGSGISGAVCASTLARNGLSVTIFDSARGPGGRMSQRREITEDGRELLFDHGAPYFTASDTDVLGLIRDWEARGLVEEWKENFGSFDVVSKQFGNIEKEGPIKKYVGVPGMNSICKALCNEPGVHGNFGVGVGRLEWLDDENSWSLTGSDGQYLGHFKGVVASDKNIVSPRFTSVTGRPPPLGYVLTIVPLLSRTDLSLVPELATKVKEIPVNSCFALMLAFEEPLSLIPVKGFSFNNSEVLSWAFCNSSKPGRSTNSEQWVLHSTDEYAKGVIAQMGLQKPSNAALAKVADELLQELQGTGLNISHPLFMKAHRCTQSCVTGVVLFQLQASQERRNASGMGRRDWPFAVTFVLILMLKAQYLVAWPQPQNLLRYLASYSQLLLYDHCRWWLFDSNFFYEGLSGCDFFRFLVFLSWREFSVSFIGDHCMDVVS